MIKSFFSEMHSGQKMFGEDIQRIINSFLLTFIYLVGVGLTSLFAKTLNKKFLDLAILKKEKTYWEDFDNSKNNKEGYYKQF